MTANRLANRTFVWQGLRSLVAMLVVIIYSRLMGAEGRGQLSILLINVQFFMLVLEWMVGSTVPNFMVKYGLKKTVRFSLISTAIIVILWCIIQGCVITWLSNNNNEGMALNSTFSGACLLSALACLNVLLGYFQFKGWVEHRNRLQVLVEVLKLTLLLVGLTFLSSLIVQGPLEGLGVLGMLWVAVHILDVGMVMWILVAATWMSVLIAMAFCFKSIVSDWRNMEDQSTKDVEGATGEGWWEKWWLPKSAFMDGFWSQAGHLLYFALTRSPLWVINYYSDDKSVVGILANVWLMWDTLMIVGNSYGVVIHSVALTGSATDTLPMLSQFTLKSLFRSLLLCGLVLIIPSDVYSTIFGWQFGNMYLCFAVLSPVVVLATVASPYAHWLHATNRFKEIFNVYLVSMSTYAVLVLLGLCFRDFSDGMELGLQQAVVGIFGEENGIAENTVLVHWELISLIPAFAVLLYRMRSVVNRVQ